jgi:predicted metal-binding membrane protein
MGAQVRRSELRAPAALAVLALAAVSWWLSVGRMTGMDAGPSVELGALGWFTVTWLVMMAAMMLPSIAPVLAAQCFPRDAPRRSERRVLVGVVFLVGYLAVWVLAGAGAYLVLRAGRSVAGGAFEWHRGGQWLAAAVLLLAAAYQLTSTKRRWLSRCRAPLAKPGGEPVSDPIGGAQAGVRAGLRCLASSWALMAVLFALGAMSLVWMAVVAALIAAERLTSLASSARVAAAAVLLLLAVGVAVAPGSVPGLTVPGSSAAERAMTGMDGASGMSMGRGRPAQSTSGSSASASCSSSARPTCSANR